MPLKCKYLYLKKKCFKSLQPLFGQNTGSTNLFGNPATTQTPAFGGTPTFGGFGTTNQQSVSIRLQEKMKMYIVIIFSAVENIRQANKNSLTAPCKLIFNVEQY